MDRGKILTKQVQPALCQERDDTENTRKAFRWIYMGMMAVTLTGYVYLLLYGVGIDEMPAVFWAFRVLTAVMAIGLGKLWKDRLFLLLSVYLGYMFLRIFFITPDHLFAMEGSENLLSGLWLCAACYGLPAILSEKELKCFLRWVIAVWTVGIMVDCGAGIYAAWTDQVIQGPGIGAWVIEDNRLTLIVLPTLAGGILIVSLMMTITMAFVEKKKIAKVLYSLASVILMLTLALTDSRTSYLCLAAGIGAMSFIGTYRIGMQKGIRGIWIWLIATLAMAAGAMLSFLAVHSLTHLFNAVKLKGGLLVSNAFAEAAEQTKQTIVTRSYFSGGGLYLSGRAELWQSIAAYLKSNPLILFFGNSVVSPLRGVTDYYAHSHNTPLQLTMEDGLVGCLPLWIFLGIIAFRSFRVIKKEPLWLALVPAVVLSQWVGEMAETYTWFRSSQCIMSPVLFICMGIISVQGRKTDKSQIQFDEKC